MANLQWKRKATLNVSATSAAVFQNDNETEEPQFFDDWRTLIPSKKLKMLEDNKLKSKRLVDEATVLAEETRYWEAIQKFNEALEYTPDDAKIFEMKAQALLEVGELFPAVESAESAVKLQANWAEAYQTLGRAQISIGEIKMALTNFCKAYHIKPNLQDLYKDDICWAMELLEKKKNIEKEESERENNDSKSKNEEFCLKCIKCGKEPLEKKQDTVRISKEDTKEMDASQHR